MVFVVEFSESRSFDFESFVRRFLRRPPKVGMEQKQPAVSKSPFVCFVSRN